MEKIKRLDDPRTMTTVLTDLNQGSPTDFDIVDHTSVESMTDRINELVDRINLLSSTHGGERASSTGSCSDTPSTKEKCEAVGEGRDEYLEWLFDQLKLYDNSPAGLLVSIAVGQCKNKYLSFKNKQKALQSRGE